MITKESLPNVQVAERLKRKDILPELKIREATKEEVEIILARKPLKVILMGGSKTSFTRESLRSDNFTRCAPVLLIDALNTYSALFHIDANVGELSGEQVGTSIQFPNGLLRMIYIKNTHRGIRASDTAVLNMVGKHREDVITTQIIEIKTAGRYSVVFSPKDNQILIVSDSKDMTPKIIDNPQIQLTKVLPELQPLADQCRVPIRSRMFFE